MASAVNLRVYDISSGAAKKWSSILLGRQIQGVWHSGIEVYGFEYFYGGGIVKMKPENVELTFGLKPTCIHYLGSTEVSRGEFEKYLLGDMAKIFNKDLYNLTEWNCNHFTNHCTNKLLKKDIPKYITELPKEVNETFMGKILINFLKMISGGNAPISMDHPASGGLPAPPPSAPPLGAGGTVTPESFTHPRPRTRSGDRDTRSGAWKGGPLMPPIKSRGQSERLTRCRRNSCPPSPTNAALLRSHSLFNDDDNPVVTISVINEMGERESRGAAGGGGGVVDLNSTSATTAKKPHRHHHHRRESATTTTTATTASGSGSSSRLTTGVAGTSVARATRGGGGGGTLRIERIAGLPLGEESGQVETEILVSPMHRRLYELERDLYAPRRPSGEAQLEPPPRAPRRSSVIGLPPVQITNEVGPG